jgi:hypothetical protein
MDADEYGQDKQQLTELTEDFSLCCLCSLVPSIRALRL